MPVNNNYTVMVNASLEDGFKLASNQYHSKSCYVRSRNVDILDRT